MIGFRDLELAGSRAQLFHAGLDVRVKGLSRSGRYEVLENVALHALGDRPSLRPLPPVLILGARRAVSRAPSRAAIRRRRTTLKLEKCR